MTWYLGKTTTKIVKLPRELHFEGSESAEDLITQERGEFAVERQLLALGIEAHAPRKVELKRRGKKRTADKIENPYLPGYFFADIPADKFAAAQEVRGLLPGLMAIPAAEVKREIRKFLATVDDENAEAQRILDANDKAAMCQFAPGEASEILAGPFMDRLVRFKRMYQNEHDPHPMIEARAELFGQEVKLTLDPLDVRGAA